MKLISAEMDLCIRFWNNEKCEFEDRCWSSVFLGHTTHLDIFEAFKNGIKRLDATRMIQVSMVDPVSATSFTES